ncbi:hypothetical protein [Kitasatospora sp. NPDC002965]|uniref:hypothetical protein n=1 Tax=Kitasatospora sp. NPDC002965 TaxID=3154775 RepID=UPI0033AB65F3
MPTRQLRDERPPTTPEEDPSPSREPVLIGDILFETLTDLARRGTPTTPVRLPTQRPHP